MLLAGAALPLFFFGWMFVSSARFIPLADSILNIPWKRTLTFAAFSMLAAAGLTLLLTPSTRFGGYASAVSRLAPLVYLGGLIGIQSLIALFLWAGGKLYFQALREWKVVFIAAGVFMTLAGLTAAWAAWSGVGIQPQQFGWHTPGTPILFSQVLAALLISLLAATLKNRLKKSNFETLAFTALWMTAFVVWQSEPMRRLSYFTPAPTPPNFETYPYSDAGFYDTLAQTILIGQGRSLTVVLRPLYVFFLTALHLVAGQDYALILTLQTMFLALTPAFAFLLVSRMGSPTAGMLSALLLIFREKNSIALTNILEVSHSKLLLSDFPTAALTLAMVFALINWLKDAKEKASLGIVSGAAFGLVVLARSQAQALLPAILLGIFFSGGFSWKKALSRTLVFALGLLVVVTPWVWRNVQVSGKPVVENNEFYIRMLAGGYAEPTDNLEQTPGESFDAYAARMRGQIIRYVFNHPLEVARAYASYFIHNEIGAVVYLPMSFRLYDLFAYVKQTPFWSDPYIDLENAYGAMFFFNLGMIALGVGAAFKRLGFLGFIPLLIHFAYSLSVVVARISGWRFIMPVDWISQMYYALGLIQLLDLLAALVWNRKPAQEEKALETRRGNAPLAAAFFLFVGLSLPIMELALPQRYPHLPASELIQMHADERFTTEALTRFLETESGAVVAYGRALYPSYYERGKFWGESSPNLVAASQFNRIQFTLIGGDGGFVFLPLEEAPQSFPHAADVFVVGCRREGYVRALLVKANNQTLTASPWNGLTCPQKEQP
ncbi:MAG: glycosyltransferase family 39 protein [Chloroflexi bacterium]|nr:glycosyltransferase family 39 protein [Chloroflexota bacterium]